MFQAGKDPAAARAARVFAARTACRRPLVLFASPVAAGFPSPAEDYVEGRLDLNEHLIYHPAATFFVRVKGESMLGAGIHPDDLLVVDRSLEARSGDIVIAAVAGELVVKRLGKAKAGWRLEASSPDFPPIAIGAEADCAVWGVVTGSVRRFERR